jgi:hypothetical protein
MHAMSDVQGWFKDGSRMVQLLHVQYSFFVSQASSHQNNEIVNDIQPFILLLHTARCVETIINNTFILYIARVEAG